MKLLIDSANLKDIAKMIEYYPISGVTTNPTILSRENKDPWESLLAIRNLITNELSLHAQVVSQQCDQMIKEAVYINEKLGKNTFVKIPVSEEGLKAIKILSRQGIQITATAIYTPMQALLASMAGAKWLAPYVNRLEMIGADGISVARNIKNLLNVYGYESGVLAASFKNVQQILDVSLAGVDAVTASPDVIEALLKHPLTDKAICDFTADFEKISGKGTTLLPS